MEMTRARDLRKKLAAMPAGAFVDYTVDPA
jgi:hypothetical protein